jgi:hypothetical protein
LVLLSFCIIIAGCSGEKSIQSDDSVENLSQADSPKIFPGDRRFIVEPKYSYIRSYPGGGGIFIVKLVTDGYFNNDVRLYMVADPALNARIDKRVLSPSSDIAEITIRPDDSIGIGIFEIELKAVHAGNPSNIEQYQKIALQVELFQWGPTNPVNVIPKRDEFIAWLETEHPELGNFSDRIWFPYMTYPQIWIVEHWTFLDEDWEFRLCYHVTIPPYDWSKILLRRRGEWNPILAATRESDGTIHEIPVVDYPIMFGY